ncbi:MAG: class II fructose-bisphosphate aldolase [Alphaproteobacteria bacterium]|nr:class II fructose-bisphosphate aldolase [Alphaproteobacteria bacterium]
MARSGATKQPPGDGPAAQRGEKPPAVIIHSLTQAVAALNAAAEARRPVVLLSAPDAGVYAGAAWFREVTRAAREAVPKAECSAILDCGNDAGAAMAAIRAGVNTIVFAGRADAARRLADIAAQNGAELLTERPAAILDLGASFFATAEALRRRCLELLGDK